MPASPRPLLLALVILGALAVAIALRLVPPGPRDAGAPADAFSAARAAGVLRDLAGDGAPRPVGSAANLRTADAIAARLKALGLETRVQETFACGVYGACARVRNILARLGSSGPKAVLLVAHHDSVGAGPGVSDDLSAVAIVLEVARALAEGPPLPRPVVALITDGEESGLVGASAFTERDPWAAQTGAIVNLEARGTTGPSILFDTSGDPAWVARVARRMPHPVITSLAPAIYDLLPNDTDLTVLGRSGLPGLNLAFADGVVRYHTPLDDLRHLDPRSLQHQGDNALALVRALAEEDLEHPLREESAYVDLLGLTVVSYRYPLVLAIAAALTVTLAATALLRHEERPLRALLAGLGAAVAAPVAAALPILLARLALRSGALPRPFVAHPEPLVLAAWVSGAAAALLAAAAVGRRAGATGLFAGFASLQALLGLALAATLPGASHLAVLPAFAAGLAGLAWAPRRGRLAYALGAAIAPGAVAALVIFPVALLLPSLLGVTATIPVASLSALALGFATPLAAGLSGRARWVPPAALLAAVFVLAGVQAALPHATADRPARGSLAYHEEAGAARWLAQVEHDDLPAALRRAVPFSQRREAPFAWAPRRLAFSAPAGPHGLPPPRLVSRTEQREASGLRRVRARLVSERGAPVVLLLLPPGVEILHLGLEGVTVPEPPPKARRFWADHRPLGCATTPPGGVEIEAVLRSEAPVPVLLVDQSPGLPPEGARLVAARPPTEVPSQDGDVTLVTARAEL